MKRRNSQDGKAATGRTESRLQEGLEKRLLVYVVGACAAGALASPPPVMAEIVYTATNTPIFPGDIVPINIEGATEFKLTDKFASIPCTGDCGNSTFETLFVNAGTGAGAVVSNSIYGLAPAALKLGAVIGPADQFQGGNGAMAGYFISAFGFIRRVFGNFYGATGRYLGLKFTLHGQVHYGWARFSSVQRNVGGFDARLRGYAFETVPNKPIYAGQTRDSSESRLLPANDAGEAAKLQLPTLGLLALGSIGLNAWRKKEALEAQPSEAR